jgi:archaemetzincin
MPGILVLPLPGAEALSMELLSLEIESLLHCPVVLGEGLRNVDLAYDPSRDQYNSRRLLEMLHTLRPPEADRILGVTGLDLFIPVLTFVFGEAQLQGPASVVSYFRLDNRYYGLPEDPQLLQDRLVKEAVHELGHTFGLLHCPDTRCVMRSSTYVEQIDLKDSQFCMDCGETLHKRITSNS